MNSMKVIITGCILLLIVLLVVAGIVCFIRNKLKGFSRSVFGTDSLVEGYHKQEEELATTPKSVSGMTRLLEPQIQWDFPEFNWVQFKNQSEQVLKEALLAIASNRIEDIPKPSQALAEQVKLRIEENTKEGCKESYEQIQIHQTEIAKYEKRNGRCIITLQSAVGHIHYREQAGKLISGKKDMPEQTKYNVELMYIQDEQQTNGDKGVGLTCPHCGAPVKNLGVKHCEYCGSEVVPINMQVWSLQHFYEVSYQKV